MKEYTLRFDSLVNEEEVIKALSGETKPRAIIIGQSDLGRISAAKVAALLKNMDVALIVGDVSDISDKEILKIIKEMPDTQLGITTNVQRNTAALQAPVVMKIENTYEEIKPFFLDESKEIKRLKENNKHRRNHVNRNQNFKGRK